MTKLSVGTSIVTQPAAWDMGFHEHAGIEVSAVLEGRGYFESRKQVFPIEAGHVVIIPAGIPHSYRAETEMRFGVLEAVNMRPDTMSLFSKLTANKPALLQLSPIFLEQYEGLFRQWLRMISQPLKEKDKVITTWVELLLLFLLEHHNPGSRNISVAASADYIRSNLRSEISIAMLAKQCGLSEPAYRLLFKEAFGESPKQFQQACRMAEAKWLLRATNRPMQAIAEQIGFSGIHAFSAWFQKIEAIPPSEWRRTQQSRM